MYQVDSIRITKPNLIFESKQGFLEAQTLMNDYLQRIIKYQGFMARAKELQQQTGIRTQADLDDFLAQRD